MAPPKGPRKPKPGASKGEVTPRLRKKIARASAGSNKGVPQTRQVSGGEATVNMAVRFTSTEHALIHYRARAIGQSASAVVRQLVARWLLEPLERPAASAAAAAETMPSAGESR